MVERVRHKQQEMQKLEDIRDSKERLPPNSRYFDVRTAYSRSTIDLNENKLKYGNSQHQKSQRSLNAYSVSKFNKEEYMQQEQAKKSRTLGKSFINLLFIILIHYFRVKIKGFRQQKLHT